MKKEPYFRRLLAVAMYAAIFPMFFVFSSVTLAHAVAIKGQGILDKQISLQVSQMEVATVLKKIESQTAARFVYQPEVVSDDKISLNVKSATIAEILQTIFGSSVSYESIGNMVVLRQSSKADDSTVTGKVTDETGAPMTGVNVTEKGTTNGTMTDADGKFTLQVTDESSVLVFSSIGYAAQEVTVGNQSNFSLSMQPDVKQLEEVVVVGYGTQVKKNVTGSVARVTGEDIANQPVNNVTDALVGKMAGVTITQGTGQPGAPLTIKVRGVGTITAGSDPLYVVDGMPLSGPNLNTLNNNDIESVEVLKDASSAAIYGSPGANGVVIITTKNGKDGKTIFNYDGYVGVQNAAHKIEMLDAYQYAQFAKDGRDNAYKDQMQQINRRLMASGKPTIGFSLDDSNGVRMQNTSTDSDPLGNVSTVIAPELVPYLLNEPGLTNTDWQDQIFRAAPIQKHSLSASGGSPHLKYYSSVAYFKEDGIIINSNFERFSARFNMEANKEIARFGFNFNPALVREKLVNSDGTYFSGGVVGSALQQCPIFPVFNEDGSYNFSQNSWTSAAKTLRPDGRTAPGNSFSAGWNPVALAMLPKFNRNSNRILFGGFTELEFLDNLKYKVYAGVDILNSREDKFLPSTIPLLNSPINEESAAGGYSRTNAEFNWVLEHTLSYSKRISKHNINALIGGSIQKDNFKSNYVSATKGFLGNQIPTINSGTVTAGDSRESEWSLASGIARLQYNFSEKYLFTGSIRMDGSSKFGANNRWGYFPSASVGWRLNQENFLKDVKAIDELKIRLSYGLSGNFNIPSYGALGSLSYYAYVFGSSPSVVNGAAPSSRPNPNLQWEKTAQTNLGLDASFFQSNLRLTLDLYNSDTKGLLLDVPVPLSTGFVSQLQNIGQVNNKGIELNLGTAQEFGKLKWEGNLVFAKNVNKVMALGPGNADIIRTGGTTNAYFLTRVGETIGSYYLPRALGVFKNQAEVDSYPHYTDSPANFDFTTSKPGDFKFEDADGNGRFDPNNDRVILGSYLPKFTYGFTSGFQYKNFDLNFALQGVYGNKILNLSRRHFYNHEANQNNYAGAVNRWRSETETGSGFNIRSNRQTKGGGGLPSSWHVEDGSYLRIRTITLGYSLPVVTLKKHSIEKVRFYFVLQNPFTFTGCLGYNPEVTNRSDVATAGEDYGVYPTSKTASMGVNITF